MLLVKWSDILAELAQQYENNPLIKAVIKLIPYCSAFDAFMTTNLNNVKKENLRIFFQSISDGETVLTPEIIKSNEFLFCFEIAYKASLECYRREKVEYFAQLFKNAIQPDQTYYKIIEDYEAYVSILRELDYREISLLIKISLLEDGQRGTSDNPLMIAHQYWKDLAKYALIEFKVQEEELHSHLIRLQRTGCYELFKGKFFDDTKGLGQTTPLFKRLKDSVSINNL